MIKNAAINEQYLNDGYVILRNVVPVDQLKSQRHACNLIVALARDRDPS